MKSCVFVCATHTSAVSPCGFRAAAGPLLACKRYFSVFGAHPRACVDVATPRLDGLVFSCRGPATSLVLRTSRRRTSTPCRSRAMDATSRARGTTASLTCTTSSAHGRLPVVALRRVCVVVCPPLGIFSADGLTAFATPSQAGEPVQEHHGCIPRHVHAPRSVGVGGLLLWRHKLCRQRQGCARCMGLVLPCPVPCQCAFDRPQLFTRCPVLA